MHDLSQYPVYPWVLADYASRTLDLTTRLLSGPVEARRRLNAKRLATFRERFRGTWRRHRRWRHRRTRATRQNQKSARASGLIAQTAFGRKLVQQGAAAAATSCAER